jgi:HD superfamily phosphohydrolase
MQLQEREMPDEKKEMFIVWPDKSKYALEEYLFSRFYMYQSVYFHHTTRGYEILLRKLLQCAQEVAKDSKTFKKTLLSPMKTLMQSRQNNDPMIFLGLTDDVLLAQIRIWSRHRNKTISDLSKRLLLRKGLVWHELPPNRAPMEMHNRIEEIQKLLKSNGLHPSYYFFEDGTKAIPYKPYSPASSSEEQSSVTSIMLYDRSWPETGFYEITDVPGLKRLKAIAEGQFLAVRYYFPKEHENQIRKLLG